MGLVAVFSGSAGGQTPETDVVSLILIPADLEDASQAMTVFDRNEDGRIDADEQQRVAWRSKVADFDLNRDGKLSHLEVALRFARLREDSDVIQIDRNIASKYLRRHDLNRNGQLDADELAAGWPPDPDEFDKNHDGVLTVREIAETFAFRRGLRIELGIMGVDQGGAIKIMNRYDQNSDHRLNAEEWASANLPRDPNEFDIDENGKLTVMEVATMLAKHRMDSGLSKADQLQARALIAQLDRDRSGSISKEELQSAETASRFSGDLSPFDKNKDGEITLAEVEAKLADERKKKGYMDRHALAAQRMMLRHDQNRDGVIAQNELDDSKAEGNLTKSMLDNIDIDSDRRISLDELARYVARGEGQ